MPRIFLKPNSAEFLDQEADTHNHTCDMPGCHDKGAYKAPKNRGLDEYYHFCLDHVREYNQAWDFFDGMSSVEVEEHLLNSLYGDRPTWRYDSFANEEMLRQKSWQFGGFENNSSGQDPNKEQTSPYRNTPEYEALAIMGLEPPLDFPDIKARYKQLVKKYHPDLNGGDKKSEDLLKRVNMAYTILKLSYEQFEKLPERE